MCDIKEIYVLTIEIPFLCEKGTEFVKMENPIDLPKNKVYYSPKGKFFPIYNEFHIANSPYFQKIT